MIPPALESAAVPIDDVKGFPGNARRHDLEKIKGSLAANGQFRPIIANRQTGHIIKGNGTHKAAKALGWPRIAVSWIDVPADQEARLVLVDNRASELGWFNDAQLLDVLQGLGEDSLLGTGYTTTDLDSLEKSLAGDLDLLPPAPPDPGDVLAKQRDRFDLADVKQLVLVVMPDAYDRLVADLDALGEDGETQSDTVYRLLATAAGAR